MRSQQSPWLTVAEGAAYVRMSPGAFRTLVDTGEVRSYARCERYRFVDARELDELMRSLPSGSKAHPALRAR